MIPIAMTLCPGSNPDHMFTALSEAYHADMAVDMLMNGISLSPEPTQFLLDLLGKIHATTDPLRDFVGQPHSVWGERGKQEVRGVNMRDISDCLVNAIARSVNDQLTKEAYDRVNTDKLEHTELYDLDLSKADPIAIVQNLVVEIEKRMGIYPNVPKLQAIAPEEANEAQ